MTARQGSRPTAGPHDPQLAGVHIHDTNLGVLPSIDANIEHRDQERVPARQQHGTEVVAVDRHAQDVVTGEERQGSAVGREEGIPGLFRPGNRNRLGPVRPPQVEARIVALPDHHGDLRPVARDRQRLTREPPHGDRRRQRQRGADCGRHRSRSGAIEEVRGDVANQQRQDRYSENGPQSKRRALLASPGRHLHRGVRNRLDRPALDLANELTEVDTQFVNVLIAPRGVFLQALVQDAL